ncbi:MAG: thiol reductase thioredoxin [Candidatus Rokuibacteriota bacterium]|nr:MAG: thiol reductase thioredoxin [Candidatus Rokubacteria bacterium]
MNRFVALLTIVAALMPALSLAGPVAKYNKQALEQAQDAGKPIIVFVTASWCPNCRAQQPIVDTLTKDPAFSEAVLFVVDYDSEKQALRELNVTMQSTLIAFRGKTERKRSTAVTDPEQIRALFQSAL